DERAGAAEVDAGERRLGRPDAVLDRREVEAERPAGGASEPSLARVLLRRAGTLVHSVLDRRLANPPA
ncbi:MAG: hypothetical protein ACF8XB_14695, partial [Planctomycetota bacterium JB042]